MMRVFIADDEEIIRDGIRNCIEKEQERFLFAGEAPDGEMALPMLMEMKPDVLITDIRMPFMDGLELAKVVRRTMPWLRIADVPRAEPYFPSPHSPFRAMARTVCFYTSPEEANKSYQDFKALQQEWKEIKNIPADKANEVWKNCVDVIL